jgi:hypothetical protein
MVKLSKTDSYMNDTFSNAAIDFQFSKNRVLKQSTQIRRLVVYVLAGVRAQHPFVHLLKSTG